MESKVYSHHLKNKNKKLSKFYNNTKNVICNYIFNYNIYHLNNLIKISIIYQN